MPRRRADLASAHAFRDLAEETRRAVPAGHDLLEVGSILRYNLGLARASARSDYFGTRARRRPFQSAWSLARALSPSDSRRHLFRGYMNAALKQDHEVVTALGQLSRLGLAPHVDREKNWDAFRRGDPALAPSGRLA